MFVTKSTNASFGCGYILNVDMLNVSHVYIWVVVWNQMTRVYFFKTRHFIIFDNIHFNVCIWWNVLVYATCYPSTNNKTGKYVLSK